MDATSKRYLKGMVIAGLLTGIVYVSVLLAGLPPSDDGKADDAKTKKKKTESPTAAAPSGPSAAASTTTDTVFVIVGIVVIVVLLLGLALYLFYSSRRGPFRTETEARSYIQKEMGLADAEFAYMVREWKPADIFRKARDLKEVEEAASYLREMRGLGQAEYSALKQLDKKTLAEMVKQNREMVRQNREK